MYFSHAGLSDLDRTYIIFCLREYLKDALQEIHFNRTVDYEIIQYPTPDTENTKNV